MSDMEDMTKREYDIYKVLLEAEEAFYVPEDKSDLYGLAPKHFQPGLLRIPGEYEHMTEDEIMAHVNNALDTEKWFYIPLRNTREDE